MAENEKVSLETTQPPQYTAQPTQQASVQPGYPSQPGYAPQSGYPPEGGHPNQPSYPPQGGYQPQGGHPHQPDYAPQPHTAQPPHHGPPPVATQPVQQVQQSNTVINVGAPTAPIVVMAVSPRPNTYMCLSVFTCLCCAWPIGLAAIVFSCLVDSSYGGGDYDGAVKNSNIARWLNVASIILGIVLYIVIFTTGVRLV